MATDNVYRKIELFYQRKKESNMIVRKTRMERYFRELAWQGKTDALLRRIFGVVSTLLAFMVQRKLGAFYLLTRYDYVELFHIYASARPKLRLIEQNVELFFSYLNDFLQAMTPDDEEVHTVLRESRALFYENGVFAIPERQNYDEFCDTLEHTEEIDEDALDHLNELLDGLVTDMIAYFQRDEHRQDFARAIMLFSGPYIKPENADENWWLSFWDYFFFDYHRKEDDLSIVRYYLEAEKDRLSTEQQYVLRDLMRAKLTVFCVNYLDEDVAVCTNLFSGEEINLPCPDVGFAEYKNTVFFGHIQRRGVMLLNYISGLSASKRLQRRIKDEILKQFEQFRAYQMPSATLEDFFIRHAAAVRHTIQILSGFAQLRVVPDIIAAPPERGAISAALLEPEETRLEETARSLHFSAYAIFFAKRLYEDYVAKIK
ncbi:MAG: hypothetical protein J5477_02250, partial [Schwartzia sp.]|nr:hypothetical protein [Schwartzia sp. (in: firmicutes)]